MKNLRKTFSNIDRTSKSKGLTLVESLVAISVLVIAVFGPMSIVAQSIRTAYLTRDQMTAFYLAQEAIEHVRNVKDKNSLQLNDTSRWLTGLVGGTVPTINEPGTPTPIRYTLELDPNSGYDLVQCGATCPKLNIDRDSREYGAPTISGNVVASIYTREVTFWELTGDPDAEKEVAVHVTVRWQHTGNNYEYVVRDYLKNWKMTQ